MSISWKFHEYPSARYPVMLRIDTDPENRKLNSVSKAHHPQNIAGCSLCRSRPILKILWQSIHPFYHNVPNRQASKPRWKAVKQSSQAWNGLANHVVCRALHLLKKSLASVHWLTIPLLRNADIENKNIDHGYKELNATSRQFFRLLLASCPTLAENFMKIHSPFSRYVSNRRGFPCT